MYLYKQGNPRKKAQRGFTLVELLLVLVILALIAGLVLPGIIGKAESAKSKAAASAISRISMSALWPSPGRRARHRQYAQFTR